MKKANFVKHAATKLMVRFDGTIRNLEKEPEEINKIVDAIKAHNAELSQETADHLNGLLNPVTRINWADGIDVDSNGNLYLSGTSIPMPEELSETVKRYHDEDLDLTPLIKFWKLAMLNPSEDARQGFYKYIRDYGIVITENGYALLYKAVNVKAFAEGRTYVKGATADTRSVDNDLSRFVSAEYLKIKSHKKSPKNYYVYEVYDVDTGETLRYDISTHQGEPPEHRLDIDEDMVEEGNLQDLYDEFTTQSDDTEDTEENTADTKRKAVSYVPWYKGDFGMDIQLGKPQYMPREKCDPNINADCSNGLHVGSYRYVKRFGSNMDAILAVLVNPADVVALPRYDHSKIRVCEYYPYAEIRRTESGDWEELDSPYFEDDFLTYEINELEMTLSRDTQNQLLSKDQKAKLEDRLVALKS